MKIKHVVFVSALVAAASISARGCTASQLSNAQMSAQISNKDKQERIEKLKAALAKSRQGNPELQGHYTALLKKASQEQAGSHNQPNAATSDHAGFLQCTIM